MPNSKIINNYWKPDEVAADIEANSQNNEAVFEDNQNQKKYESEHLSSRQPDNRQGYNQNYRYNQREKYRRQSYYRQNNYYKNKNNKQQKPYDSKPASQTNAYGSSTQSFSEHPAEETDIDATKEELINVFQTERSSNDVPQDADFDKIENSLDSNPQKPGQNNKLEERVQKKPYDKKAGRQVIEMSYPSSKYPTADDAQRNMSSLLSITMEQRKGLESLKKEQKAQNKHAYFNFEPNVSQKEIKEEPAIKAEPKNNKAEENNKTNEAMVFQEPKINSEADVVEALITAADNFVVRRNLDGLPLYPGDRIMTSICGDSYYVSMKKDIYAGERKRFIPEKCLIPILKNNGIPVLTHIGDFSVNECNYSLHKSPYSNSCIQSIANLQDQQVIKIASTLAAIHTIPLDAFADVRDFIPWENDETNFLISYKDLYLNMLNELMKDSPTVFSSFGFPDNPQKVFLKTKGLSKKSHYCLCHGNITHKSLFFPTDYSAVTIADWENAVFAPAAYDVAIILCNLELTHEQEEIFFNTYLTMLGLDAKIFKKDVAVYRALEDVRYGIACLSGTYYGIINGIIRRELKESLAEKLVPILGKAYDVLEVSYERRYKESKINSALEIWFRDRGPGPSEWIPSDPTLDIYFERLKQMQFF